MKIVEAKRRVMRLRVASVTIRVVSATFFLMSILKSVAWAVHGDTTALSHAIQLAVYYVFERTQFLSWVWQVAPLANPREINTTGNFGLAFILCCGALGRPMRDSASHLSERIKKTIQRVEELGWEQGLVAQQGHLSGQKPDVLQINIDLEQKDQWYKRPFGLVLLSIAIAVLGQWTNLQFGLVK